MEKIYDIYINNINNGDDFLKGISFEEYLNINMMELKSKGFDVQCNEDSINNIFNEQERIWNSKKRNKITFMPAALSIDIKEILSGIISNASFKDVRSSKWQGYRIDSAYDNKLDSNKVAYNESNCNEINDNEVVEVKCIKSSIDVNDIINNYEKLKIKDGYTLQIYKVKYLGIEKSQIFAFKNIDSTPNIAIENLIDNIYKGVEVSFKEAEDNYLNAIECDKSPEGYLQVVLLNNIIEEICGSDDCYELIDRRTILKEDNLFIEAPNFYYDDNGNDTIEYFKKYNTYNIGYKRVINTFNRNMEGFKIVEQFIALFM